MKKAVFITYNQALTERVAFLLDQLQIKGFTQWPLVNVAGPETGEPENYGYDLGNPCGGGSLFI